MSETKGGGSADMLDQLWKDTESRIQSLSGKAQSAQGIDSRLAELQQEMDSVADIKDKKQRDIKTAVLTAKFESIRTEAKTEEEDLATAVLGLNTLMQRMGLEYEKLQTNTADEDALTAAAEARLTEANLALAAAKEQGWFRSLFKSKDAAINEANANIDAAKQNIIDTEARVKSMARQRLLKANMESSFQQFTVMVEKTIAIMKDRIKAIEVQVQAVMTRKDEAFRIKEQAARALEQMDEKLRDAETKLQAEEQVLGTLVNGSKEWVDQESLISRLRVEVEEIRGKRNQALVLFQSKERFAQELEVHAKSQVMLRDNQKAWVTLLVSDTEERRVTFKSRLEAMKAMSDQDVAKSLDTVGVKMDQNNVDFMAKAAYASADARMKMLESQPERLKHISETQSALATAQAQIRDREAAVLEDFKRRYGIDPMDASFFNKGGEPVPAN